MVMVVYKRWVLVVVLVGGVLALAACGGKKSKTAGSTPAEATLTIEQNSVEFSAGNSGNWTQVTGAQPVKSGDAIRTNPSGRALLTFFTGTEVEISPGAELVVTSFEKTANGGHTITLKQLSGETQHTVARIVDNQSSYEVNTPSATLTVRGTAFGVQVASDGATHVEVTDGVVQAQAGQQTVDISAGQALDITANQTIPSTPYPIPVIRPPAATPTPTATPTTTSTRSGITPTPAATVTAVSG
jgi:hypothetical protein